ncbi:YqjK-like protein [Kushneria sinocarnis]|uniref:YqjK-like protein n=1 Tax=Kushneria sinocarnis TaxID=595502 RepID=A0A420WTF6_9GAMM|nr:YqjK family protein [Kushneria sinocarnis]RKQ96376.1 YqjK-like protein [Kushneria sinocarnis]
MLRDLAARRRQLEEQVVQDRLDLATAVRDWREATAPIDRAWSQVMRYRGLIALGFGTMVARGSKTRRPTGGLRRWIRRGTMAYAIGRRLRAALRH